MKKICFFLLFWPVISSAADLSMKISGLVCRKGLTNEVGLSWKASRKTAMFYLYRNSVYPVVSLYALRNSQLVARIQANGAPVKDGYYFSEYIDHLPEYGRYYYAILPANTNYDHNSLVPGLNANLFSVNWDNPLPVKKEPVVTNQPPVLVYKPVSVSKITLKTNQGQGSLFVFWETVPASPDRNIKFNLYRTRNLIESADLARYQPYREIWNDTVFEDTGLEAGIPYYYTVLADEETEIRPGTNQSSVPFWLGNTNTPVKVEREITEILMK